MANQYSLAVAAIFRDEAAALEEWVDYHRLLGVDHFWLYDDSSRDDWRAVLKPYLDAGVVEVLDWPVPTLQYFIEYQVQAYKDALRRASGRAEWLALIDIDEFLLPLCEDDVTECLTAHFGDADAVYVNWRNFGSGGARLEAREPTLERLTACSNRLHPTNAVGKSIVRPDRVLADAVWNSHHFVLEDGAVYCDGDGRPLAFRELDLQLDGAVHDRFIRLNHYQMRDETFFETVRLPRERARGTEEWLTREHHEAFSVEQDFVIVELVRRRRSSPARSASCGGASGRCRSDSP